MDFDKLGLTDNQNPLGVLPPVFARHMGRAVGSLLSEYVKKYLQRRNKRAVLKSSFFDVQSNLIENEEYERLPEDHKHAFHGGERAILYTVMYCRRHGPAALIDLENQ